MARRLKNDAEIDRFISTVINEADHHAGNVNEVVQHLSDAVRQRLNLSTDKVEVYERNGKLARTCWVTLKGNRYVFSYNYKAARIDLRKQSTQGQQLSSFDNSTSQSTIRKEVSKL